jgi:hypothetical protein
VGAAYFRHLYSEIPAAAQFSTERLCATPTAITEVIAAYAAIGVDELCFMPTIAELDQVDRFVDAIASVTS